MATRTGSIVATPKKVAGIGTVWGQRTARMRASTGKGTEYLGAAAISPFRSKGSFCIASRPRSAISGRERAKLWRKEVTAMSRIDWRRSAYQMRIRHSGAVSLADEREWLGNDRAARWLNRHQRGGLSGRQNRQSLRGRRFLYRRD